MVKGSIIKCFNCGCKVREEDVKCPECGAIFEDIVYTNLPDDMYTNLMKERNTIGDIVIGMAYIILVLGIIGSFIVSMNLKNEAGLIYALISGFTVFVTFILIRGLAEIIQVLHDIRRKSYEK